MISNLHVPIFPYQIEKPVNDEEEEEDEDDEDGFGASRRKEEEEEDDPVIRKYILLHIHLDSPTIIPNLAVSIE